MNSNYQDLIVWQKSIKLVTLVYKLTEFFPKEEIYALSNQLRRAVVSIPSNIAEGSQRSTRKDFAHFLRISKGSTAELETQLIIAKELGFIKDQNALKICLELLLEIRKMLSSLCNKIQTPNYELPTPN